MARENTRKSDEYKELTFKYLLTSTRKYLAQGLLMCIKYEQDHISKIKAHKKENKFLKKKNENL